MRNSNNAIKFLLAQYRAIFKRAYIKGLATAVLLTAGLAAGSAQALPTGFADSLEKAGDAVISGNVTISEKAFAQSITINTGNSLTVSGPSILVQVKDKVEVNGGTLTVSGNLTGLNSTDAWDANKSDMDLFVNAGTVNITNGQMVVDDVTLKSGTTVISGSYGGGQANTGVLDNHSYIYAAGINGIATVTGDANLTIGTDAHFAGRKVIIEGGTVTLSGDQTTTKDGASIIDQNALIVGGSIELNGGAIKVDAQKSGRISSNNISLAGTDITNSGSLTLSGREDNSVAQTPDYEWSQTTISMTSGLIANTGTLYLGVNTADTFTATGGSIANTGTLNIKADADFGSALSNSGTINIENGTTVTSAEDLGVLGSGTGKVSVAKYATLKLTDSAVTFSENDFADSRWEQGEGATNNTYGAGTILNAGTIDASNTAVTITSDNNAETNGGSKQSNVLFMAGGELIAGSLDVEQKSVGTGEEAYVEDFTVLGGTVTVKGNITGDNGDIKVFAISGKYGSEESVNTYNGVMNLTNEGNSTNTVSGINGFRVFGSPDKSDTNHETINAQLNVTGAWDFGGAGVKVNDYGTASFDSATVTNAGRLHMTTSGSTMTVTDSSITASALQLDEGVKEGALTAINSQITVTGKVSANVSGSISLTDNSTLTLSYAAANAEDGGEEDTDVSDDGLGDGVLKLDSTSTLALSGWKNTDGKTEITLKEYSELKDTFAGDEGFSGSFTLTGVTVTDAGISGDEVTYEQAQSGTGLSGVYDEVTVTGVSGDVSGVNDWGSVELAAGTDTLNLDSGATIELNNSGNAVSDSSGELAGVKLGSGSTLGLNGTNQAVAAITAGADGRGTVQTSSSVTVASIGAENTAVAEVKVLGTSSVEMLGDVYTNALDVQGTLDMGEKNLNITGTNETAIAGDILNAGEVNSSGSLAVTGTLTATNLTLQGTAGQNHIEIGSEDSSGYIAVNKLDLNGGNLLLDPDYGSESSIAVVTETGISGDDEDVVNINGNLGVGRNSIAILGASESEGLAALERLGFYDGYNLDQDNIGSALYLGQTMKMQSGGVVLLDATDATGTNDGLSGSIAGITNSSGATVQLGANTALVISDELTDALTYQEGENITDGIFDVSASTDSSSKFTITADADSKIIFDSTDILGGDKVNIFGNLANGVSGDFSGVDIADGVISAANGLLTGSASGNTITFELADDAATKLYNQSSPVKALTLAVMDNVEREYDTNDNGVDYIAAVNAHNGGADIEQTSRLAVYGGAVQATLMAQQSSSDAVADRLGMANPNSALVSSSNAQGGGLWLAPVYKNHDSDGFDAQGVDYGADIDLYGVALGADFTTASGVRAGGYFNVGSGEADGQGVASSVSNDFDYFGLGLYAGMTFGNFSLIADAGFTHASNDIEQAVNYHGFGTVKADTDTQAVSVGLRGEYLFATQWVDVVPHVGMRYTNLDMDSYDAVVDGYTVATTDADNMQLFSIPFGVTFSKDIALGDWSVKPVFDLTLTANAGDTEMDAATTFIGAGNLALSTEVMDDFTYGTSLGIDAKFKEAFSFGLNVGYTGSSNADEFGVNANARYTF